MLVLYRSVEKKISRKSQVTSQSLYIDALKNMISMKKQSENIINWTSVVKVRRN
ncbi:hypothetical protein bwei_5397 [Bacillus mycoides]|nr:hypothetical protein bwei_5397 [Bacillus mycoides]EEL03056.1 hypothetical protein bcere0014_53810 [Bacillus cereus BDRD-ST196]